MPQGSRDLEEIILKELDKSDLNTIRLFVSQIAKSLKHFHEKGFVHSDVKPKNILRTSNSLILIDLDGAASIRSGYSCLKVGTAYLPRKFLTQYLKLNLS
jgi:serine/threonine protein kinase